MPSDGKEELDRAADDLDASTDSVERAMAQRRATLAALKHLERIAGAALTFAEKAAIVALQGAIQGALGSAAGGR